MRMKEKQSWIAFIVCIVLVLSTIFSNGIQVKGLADGKVVEDPQNTVNTSERDAFEPNAQIVDGQEEKVDGNKTVQLLDWDERTYQVNLDASSHMTGIQNPIDIILVLDWSGGMNANLGGSDKYEIIKKFVCNLIDNLKQNSEESKVGIVLFGKETKEHDLTVLADEGGESLKNWVSKLEKPGGPAYPSEGLMSAQNMLEQNKNSHVILVASDKNENKGETEAAAEKIREQAEILHTVDLTTKDDMHSYLKEIASGPEHAYTIQNSDDISNVLTGILESIQEDIPTIYAVVKEYIDPRFEVVALPYGAGIASDEKGGQYLYWEIDISSYNEEKTRPGWETDFILKAKERYIGGNDVPTSEKDSGIYLNDKLIHPYDNETVNVKIEFVLGEVKQEAFLGETLKDYFNDEVEKEVSGLYFIDKDGDKVEYDSDMYGDIDIATLWYSDDRCENGIDPSDIRGASPKENTTYYVKVIVSPLTSGSDSALSSIGDKNGNSETDGYKYYANSSQGISGIGTYTVNLVTGSITVVKKISAEEINFNRGNPIFTLRITDENNISRYHAVEFKEEKLEGITDEEQWAYLSFVFEGLPKGNYSVGEEDTFRYQVYDSPVLEAIGENPCQISNNIFCIGSDTKSRDGKATIENKKVMDAYSSDTDVVTNHYSMKDDKIKVAQIDGNTIP